MIKPPNVDAYISRFPESTQALLQQMRDTIRKVAPEAEEVISYAMPAYKLHGILLYFAAYSAHIGFYPTGSAVAAFQQDLTPYKWAKGSIQFPLDKPLPLALIRKMVKFRVAENKEKAKLKKKAT